MKKAILIVLALVATAPMMAQVQPRKVGMFVSSTGTISGTWSPLMLSGGGTAVANLVPEYVGIFYSTDGTGNPGTWAPCSASCFSSATGTVTSFSATATASPFFTTAVSTPTSTPVLNITVSTQAANCVFAGPTTGSAATPTCRALVAADIAGLSLPPTGAAGGDLSGSYPNPSVAQVNGAAVPTSASYVGTNSSEQIVSATTPLLPANNLSDVANLHTALGNLFPGTNSNTYAGNGSPLLSAGTDSTSFGYNALHDITTGVGDTAIGYYALVSATTAGYTTAVGWEACYAVTTVGQDTCIGYSANTAGATDYNEIVIGYGVLGHGSDTITLGNPSYTNNTYLAGTVLLTTRTAPTVSSNAGTGSLTNGTDNAGIIATGATSTTTTLTYAFPFGTWSSCTVSANNATALPYVSAISKTAVTFTYVTTGTPTLYYTCFGT